MQDKEQVNNNKENHMTNATKILQALYDSEINASIWWNWDGGIEVRIGNGIYGDDKNWWHRTNVETVAEAIEWLKQTAFEFWPDSTFTKNNKQL